jgi:alpha-amylase/alpha-mannosidase (GH57 family)
VRSLIIHGHFYQPPRENPWTGQIENEPSAAPFRNWNDRIKAECYRPNAWARIFDHEGRILKIVNNYELLSFNFGPTLLSWMELNHPRTYQRILMGDQLSQQRSGHGNAIAQGYNHAILPLANARDLRTQIRWGLADFAQRFGRAAVALWLPETACNEEVLEALIEAGMRFAILAPQQAARVRALGAASWQEVKAETLDTSQAYSFLHRDGSGRAIALFFYDGRASSGTAFDNALTSSKTFLDRLKESRGETLVHIATDGETYGHHFRFGDLTLAHALSSEASRVGFSITNYSAHLAEHPPRMEVLLATGDEDRGTSWSCAHGVGRWYRDCGCSTGGEPGWKQTWRGPLREALDLLRDHAAAAFEATRGGLFRDPWKVRDEYIQVLGGREPEEWLAEHGVERRSRTAALSHLELQRCTLLMYTSCGWFFNDPSGIETVQILKYAALALDHMQRLGLQPPTESFLARLAKARSNRADRGNCADIFQKEVEPLRFTNLRPKVREPEIGLTLGRVLAQRIAENDSPTSDLLALVRTVRQIGGDLTQAQEAL